ncbi:MAG TPA: PAS domain S-box protein [Streptosporangiaceae bacterium]|nr:PAS domain S-box protein [Streptosporangiaceae bacterium]
MSAAVRDVSDRAAAEERISELALIVESSQDAILTKTLDGVITFWNAAAARMYGYTAQEAVGRHVSMLAPPPGTRRRSTRCWRASGAASGSITTRRCG